MADNLTNPHAKVTANRLTARGFFAAWFGAIRTSTGTLVTDRLFTGQTRDLANDGYFFYKARYYDASIGKFHTADTVVPGKGSPRGLNRYAYGFNNPLRFVDPNGHDPTTDGQARDDDIKQITSQDWAVRLKWLQNFVAKHHLGYWFNDIEGAISYFSKSLSLQGSQALLDADAKVLIALRDGYSGYLNGDALHDNASKAWGDFFAAQRQLENGGGISTRQDEFHVKQLRYRGEQAGVDWAVGTGFDQSYGAGRAGFIARGFVEAANQYRSSGGDPILGGFGPFGLSVIDPRDNPSLYYQLALLAENLFFGPAYDGTLAQVPGS